MLACKLMCGIEHRAKQKTPNKARQKRISLFIRDGLPRIPTQMPLRAAAATRRQQTLGQVDGERDTIPWIHGPSQGRITQTQAHTEA